jgi:hypothetical protein
LFLEGAHNRSHRCAFAALGQMNLDSLAAQAGKRSIDEFEDLSLGVSVLA